MEYFIHIPAELAWPIALLAAWFAGEIGLRLLRLPRISVYGLAGFILAHPQIGFLPQSEQGSIGYLANIAFGLILFEIGYRINLRWLRNNPWIGASSLLEAGATFLAVFLCADLLGLPYIASLLLAALMMSTSPAAVLRVINEQRGAGQVSERILHLSVFNTVLAVFAYKLVLGLLVLQSSGNLWAAGWSSLANLLLSALLGVVAGMLVPWLLRLLGKLASDDSVVFALAIVLLVSLCHVYQLSPVLASLSFGLVARHRRVTLSKTRRNFGVLGDLLSVLLFMYIASTLDAAHVLAGMALALPLIGARLFAKTGAVSLLAHWSGVNWRKGVLSGVALMPMSVFVVMMWEQTRHMGFALEKELMPLAALALLLEIVGPIMTQLALRLSGECAEKEEDAK